MCEGRCGDDGRLSTLGGEPDTDRRFTRLGGVCDDDLCGAGSGDRDTDPDDDLCLGGGGDGDLALRCCGRGDLESDRGLLRLTLGGDEPDL